MERMDSQVEMHRFYDHKQEYWGPVSQEFADAYLVAVYETLQNSLAPLKKSYKRVFSVINELLHNITDYNIKYFQEDFPPSYVSIEDVDGAVVLKFHNKILPSSVSGLARSLNDGAYKEKEEINEMCKNRILKSQSLGLLLLRRRKDIEFKWKLKKSKGTAWLNILITVRYGSISN